MFIEEIISKTIFKTLRQEVVSRGYLPNINNYDIDNTNDTLAKEAIQSYKQAQLAIRNERGFCIEIFPFSNNQSKGYKSVPRIVVDVLEFLPGKIGLDPRSFFEFNSLSNSYIRKKSSPLLSELNFMVYASGNSAEQVILMNDIIMTCLPMRGYIKKYDEETLKPSNNWFIVLEDKGKRDNLEEGITERFYRFLIEDINELPDIVLEDNIPSIIHIELDTEVDGNTSSLIIN
jgi:hypothetical protein